MRSRAFGWACVSALAVAALSPAPAMAQALAPLDDKEGPAMVNLKVGPGLGIEDSGTTFGIQLDAGYTLRKGSGEDFTEGDVYFVFSPELHIGDGATTITLPIGAQYDIPTGIDHLYVYPRITAGYTLVTEDDLDDARHLLSVQPAIGVKYVIDGKMNVGLEPVALPISLGEGNTRIDYRVWAYAGMNF